MGGNALSIETRRVEGMEFTMIENAIHGVLDANNIVSSTPRSYGAKESYGDLDILISTESFEDSNEMFEFIIANYNPKDVHRNKRVISFDYKEFQIDFILIEEECFEVAKDYYSFNDLGNLMGRIASNMGFRYGHEGLRLDYASPHMSRKLTIVLSRDSRKIFPFLGFDYSLFQSGFFYLEDVFNYVVYSKFFTKEIFQYSMLNHQNKTRNRKRVNYGKFLEYIVDENGIMPIDTGFTNLDWIGEAEKYFNIDIKSQLEAFDAEILANKRSDKTAERLNMKNIQANYDINGKELGKAITKFKIEVENDKNMTWQEFVNANDVEIVMDYFGKYNNLKKIK